MADGFVLGSRIGQVDPGSAQRRQDLFEAKKKRRIEHLTPPEVLEKRAKIARTKMLSLAFIPLITAIFVIYYFS